MEQEHQCIIETKTVKAVTGGPAALQSPFVPVNIQSVLPSIKPSESGEETSSGDDAELPFLVSFPHVAPSTRYQPSAGVESDFSPSRMTSTLEVGNKVLFSRGRVKFYVRTGDITKTRVSLWIML